MDHLAFFESDKTASPFNSRLRYPESVLLLLASYLIIQTFHPLAPDSQDTSSSQKMAPGLTEETPLPINGAKGANVENGKHAITEEFQDGPAPAKKGKYNAIPGPLGLASASLEGKVALVTGAGELNFLADPDFWVQFFFPSDILPLDVAPAFGCILPSHQFGPRGHTPVRPGPGPRVGKSGRA